MSDEAITSIIKRDGTIVPYDVERIVQAVFRATASLGAPDLALARALAAEVERALRATYGAAMMPSVEDIQDVVENRLMAGGHTALARSYIIYRHQRAQLRAKKAQSAQITDTIPYKKIYDVLVWNMNHGCDTVAGLNDIVARGGLPRLVADAERRLSAEIEDAAREILAARERVRLVVVAGPSSSGKTTTGLKIRERLVAAGVRIHTLNIDNYFFDLQYHPRDEFGDYDYETPRALDMDMINDHLRRLLNYEPVMTPRYDFKAGVRRLNAAEMRLAPGDLLLIDSLHGLHDTMGLGVPRAWKYRVYIETLGQLRAADGTFMRWADNRLMRRMIRDARHRNSQPVQTLTHWHYVRTSELKYIIPFIGAADCVINTALPYELPILKARIYGFFPAAVESFRGDPHRQDAYLRARRVQELLDPIEVVEDDACVPADSLLREFIGGSSYAY